MKTFYISREGLDDVLSMLWDESIISNTRISIEPSQDIIQVFKDDEQIASIAVLDVTDTYDLRKELFREF